jgi:co-chaperonin GroES (HSP10)
METPRAIHKDVIFKFPYDTVRMKEQIDRIQFMEKTDWGFTYTSFADSLNQPRYGIVVAVGPEVCDEIKIGQKILIEALKWTNAFVINGEKYWKTTQDFILAYEE